MSHFRRTAYTNAMESEMTFCELKRREVINGSDGRRMGHIIDIVFTADSGKIKGIILPYGKRGLFGKSQDLYVPWQCIQKIGEDVILVEIHEMPGCAPTCTPPPPKNDGLPPPPKKRRGGGGNECDGQCEKCMLFDCTERWGAPS